MATIAITPAPLDLYFVRGDDVNVQLTFKDEDADPIDMSDSVFRAQVRRTPGAEEFLSFDVNDTDSATGIIRISLSRTDTAALANTYYWDIERDVGSTVTTIMAGKVNFTRDVTRS